MNEPDLLQLVVHYDLLRRLNQLSPSSQALWGKMDVAQMLAHLTVNLDMVTSDKKVTQVFIGRLFGSIAKRDILKKGIQPKNMGSFSQLIISDHREFQNEKKELQSQLERFIRGGAAGITRQPHAFFGHMTPIEWARLGYIHMDHHLKQFGA